ncbi:MAG: DNA mismatch repair endonuclease MutL [Chlamydiales bacterium]|nr:DNA mismatch repair endonuclease MutL [Chlamydiales bacterium]
MNGKIQLLSEETINQIAAGEVVENPASVVKELIENAVDAKASRITIEIRAGGFQLIRIDDDGVGMDAEDLLLCLQRHTTSKIVKACDLHFLKTMGFRGEALASIASISKMRLISDKKNEIAHEISIDGGKILPSCQASRTFGTTVEVRSLFYNVPARKQFQKTSASSTAEITKVITGQALAHPEIDFEYIVQDQKIFSTQTDLQKTKIETLLQKSKDLLGGHFLKQVIPIDSIQDSYRFQGILGFPTSHLHNRTGQHLFINQRPVVSPLISYAIKDAYGTRIPADRYPVFVLHIQIPSHLLDVNVHPQKREVRFTDEKQIRSKVQGAIHSMLQTQAHFSPSAPISIAPPLFFPSTFQEELPPSSFRETQIPPSEKTPLLPLQPQIIGLFSHYLLINALSFSENHQEGILLFDLLKASEKITLENLLKPNGQISRQGLLIPEIFDPSQEEILVLTHYAKQLQEIGFEVRCCGKNRWMIDAIPSFIDLSQALEILRETLLELPKEHLEKIDAAQKMLQLFRAISRFARGRKKNFMLQEAQEILKQWMQLSSPKISARGDAILTFMSLYEIEKRFSL